MQCRTAMSVVGSLILTIAAVAVAPGQNASSSPPTTLPAAPRWATEARDPAAARAFFEKAMGRYRALHSYRSRARIEDRTETEAGEPSEPAGHEVTLIWQAPAQLKAASASQEIWCDGETLWAVSPELKQYRELPRADALAELRDKPDSTLLQGAASHPLFLFLLQPDRPATDLFKAIKDVVGLATEVRDGRPGMNVVMKYDYSHGIPAEAILGAWWFDDETGWLRDIRIDRTAFTRELRSMLPAELKSDEPARTKVETVVTLIEARTDAPLPEGSFTFTPPDGYRKVDEFERPDPYVAQAKLIGSPAPAFTDEDLDGKPFKLSDLRGRVVVLDFWATWCGPCVRALPSVQKVADTLADKPVTFIGVNRDGKGTKAKVQRFLEGKKIGMRQVLDLDDEASRAYAVQAIPCTVIIDPNGIVLDVHTGFAGEDALRSAVERALKGETLVSAAGLAERLLGKRPALGVTTFHEGPEEPVPANLTLPEVHPERFVSRGRAPSDFISSSWLPLDRAGGGAAYIDQQRAVVRLAADGSVVSTTALAGVKPHDFVTLVALDASGGQSAWLAAVDTLTFNLGQEPSRTAVVALFDHQGQRVWQYQPPLPDGIHWTFRNGYARDLDGDHETEYVFTAEGFVLPEEGDVSYQHPVLLLVLDHRGALLAQRRIDRLLRSVWVSDPDTTGKCTIYVWSQNLERFTFGPPAAAEREDSADTGAAPPEATR